MRNKIMTVKGSSVNKKELVLKTVHMLAKSQGFYCRVLSDIGYDGENVPYEWFDDNFKDCTNSLDVVMRFEG